MHWFITLCVNQWLPSSFLLEFSSVMPWQIGTASVYLPCHLASYSCTITLYIWATFATCSGLGPCNTKEFAFKAQATDVSLNLFYSFLLISVFSSTKRRKRRKHIVWDLLWVSSVMSCACKVFIFHPRIAEKNWVRGKINYSTIKIPARFQVTYVWRSICLKFLWRPYHYKKLPLNVRFQLCYGFVYEIYLAKNC